MGHEPSGSKLYFFVGLVLSIKYSIGYLSIADAVEAGAEYAMIRNQFGSVVSANSATVQSAMEDFSTSMDERLVFWCYRFYLC